MAYENLKRFIAERLLELDGTLADTPGSPMYSVVIDPLIERLGTDPLGTDIQAFIVSRIKSDPYTQDMDVESLGSALKDIVARPLEIILEPLRREISAIKTNQSLDNIGLMSIDEVEALVSTLFVTRKAGSEATGSVRVFFSSPRQFSIDSSIVFSTLSGIQFVPVEDTAFTEADFIRSGDLYYVEVSVQSVVAHAGANVAPDSIRLVTGLPGVARVTNPARMSSGTTEESKEALASRARKSLTERSLNSDRGIAATLHDYFEDLVSVEVVGFGEPEMQRDILSGTTNSESLECPGSVLLTVGGVTAYDIQNGSVTDTLAYISTWSESFPPTNAIVVTKATHAEFLTAWTAVAGATYVRLFTITDDWDTQMLGRTRKILAVRALNSSNSEVAYTDVSAVKMRIIMEDFSILADGLSAETTPNSNEYSPMGTDYALKNTTGNWRGAPLPFTDVIDLGVTNPLSSISLLEDRDYVCVRGYSADSYASKHFRMYPVRRKLSSRLVQIKRTDHLMSRLDATTDGSFSAAEENSVGYLPPEVVDFGCPSLGDPATDAATMFDGTTTVSEGGTGHGGVALYKQAADAFAFVKIAAHASRPNGWVSLGVQEGDYISLAAYMGDTTAYTGAEAYDWWQWARVESVAPTEASGDQHWLKVRGIVDTGIKGNPVGTDDLLSYEGPGISGKNPFGTGATYFGFPDASPYRLAWTVFKNQYEVVTTEGDVLISYAEFAYAPAYDTSGTPLLGANVGLYNEDPEVYYPWINGMALGTDASTNYVNPSYRYGSLVYATDNGVPINNRMRWAIVRLEEPLRSKNLDNNSTVIEQSVSAERVSLDAAMVTLSKYTETAAVPGTSVLVPMITPFAMSEFLWEDIGGSPSLTVPDTPNIRGARGFSVPTWFGTSSEFAQFYDTAVSSTAATSITISGVPGGYPFTDEFNGPLTVNANEVHIGGATDVFVRGGGPENAATTLKCVPHDPTVGVGYDVTYSAADGTVFAATTDEIQSLDLGATLTASEAAAMVGGGLEITASSDASVIGSVFKIIEVDYVNSTIRVDGSMNTLGVDIFLTEFRVFASARVCLTDPREVLQTGSNLSISLTDKLVECATGFTFDPTTDGTVYLKILSGNNIGEYAVVTKYSSTQVYINESLLGPETGVSFEAFTRSAPVSTPIVRITNMELSGDEAGGVPVPRRDPVSNVCSQLAGMNNDPNTFTATLVLRPAGTYAGAGSGTSTDPAHASGTYAYAQLFVADSGSTDWATLGVSAYDVVTVTVGGVVERYFVREVTSSGGKEVLTLDRDVSGTSSSLTGTVGKPSVGTIRSYFLEPTYYAVGPTTEWTSADDIVLRPSPAEADVVYESPALFTDIEITPGAPSTNGSLASSTIDFHEIDVQVGDNLVITSKVIESGSITDAVANDMSSFIGKTLILTLNSIKRSYTFTEDNGSLTLSNMVSQLNKEFQGEMFFANADDPLSGVHRLFKIYATNPVTVEDSSTGLLSALQLSSGMNNRYGASEVQTTVTAISYNAVTGVSTVSVDEDVGDIVDTITPEVFIRVERPEWQIFFPADMLEDDNGLFYVDITATSKDALTSQVVDTNTLFTVSGHTSYGYRLSADNPVLTFSLAEVLYCDFTPIVLDVSATDHTVPYGVVGSDVTINYQRSQLVGDIQSFLLSKYTRVVNNNPLARHMFPAYLLAGITGTVPAGVTAEEVSARLIDRLAAKTPNSSISAYDLEIELSRMGVTGVSNPINMAVLSHGEDRSISAVHSGDVITIDRRYTLLEADGTVRINGA